MRLIVNGGEKIYHPNTSQKKAVVDILILDIADLKRRKVIIDKKGYYKMIKGVNSSGRYNNSYVCA